MYGSITKSHLKECYPWLVNPYLYVYIRSSLFIDYASQTVYHLIKKIRKPTMLKNSSATSQSTPLKILQINKTIANHILSTRFYPNF
ncbi:unnamed protein product [Schistosoma haematobium]|nr:unnamed protein product [Schistosoma haematobium]